MIGAVYVDGGFEAVQRVNEINAGRRKVLDGAAFNGFLIREHSLFIEIFLVYQIERCFVRRCVVEIVKVLRCYLRLAEEIDPGFRLLLIYSILRGYP